MDNVCLLKEVNEEIIGQFFQNGFKYSKSIFLLFLKGIKEEYNLSILLDDTILEKSIFLLDAIEKKEEKAEVINSILNIMYDVEYDYIGKKDYIDLLLKSYLEEMDKGYYNRKNIKETMFLFLELGIEKQNLIEEMIKRYDKEKCIKIFSMIGLEVDKQNSLRYSDIVYLLERRKKLSKRFRLIFHFYLMTEKDYVKNIEIAGIYFKLYHNHMLTCADWGISSRNRYICYIEEGIISEKEEAIFTKIGDFYYNCMEKKSNLGQKEMLNLEKQEESGEELEEVFEELKIVSSKFSIQLKTKQVQDLLQQFFHGKSLFEVAFRLP